MRSSSLRLFLGGAGQWSHTVFASFGADLPAPAADQTSDQKRTVEQLWQEFFADPSQWWDHRSEKANARYPDFKHRVTGGALWLDGKWNPAWVEAKLAAKLAPGTVQAKQRNARSARYANKSRQYETTIELFEKLRREGTILPDTLAFVRILNACASLRELNKGRTVHTHIIESGHESDVDVSHALVDMYVKCGSVQDAWNVFSRMPKSRDALSWSTIIRGYVKCGQGQRALELYREMQCDGPVEIVPITFVAVLNACASLRAIEEGRRIHTQIVQNGCESNIYVASSLVDMYAKCGSIEDARRVFERMPARNVVSWNAMILGHVKCGQGQKALGLFRQMQSEGVRPGPVTFVGAVNACASLAALEDGRHLHRQIVQSNFETDVFVGSSLVDMYSKCGSIEDAWRVFDRMPARDVVSWNAMIMGHVKCGQGQKALELFREMQRKGVQLARVTFIGVLNACASVGALEEGRKAHEQIVERGYESDAFVGNSLIDMYAKCGSMEDAWRVFDSMPSRTAVAWSTMILAHVKCGQVKKALELFQQMQREGVELVPVTFVGALNACASLAALEEGKRIHGRIVKCGFESDVFVASSLIDMYSKCGSIEDAWTVFNGIATRDMVSWSTMILGYVKCGQGQKALDLFRQMQHEGLEPVPVTFVGVLNACASLGALEEGRRVHTQIVHSGFESDLFVGNSLVDMYSKCGSVEEASRVFHAMPSRDVVSWNAMILGHVKCGHGQKALELFRRMKHEAAVLPDSTTFVGVLNACASVAVLEEGRWVHEQIVQSGFETDVFVGCSLVDMYAKCGIIDEALRVFDRMPTRDVVAWNAVILGHVKCGRGQKALELFQKMQLKEQKADATTFVGVLNACASVLALEEGMRVHEQIVRSGFESDVFVGCSLVDMYSKCGSIEDAQRVFDKLPSATVVTWNAMLGGYAAHGHINEALGHFERMCREGTAGMDRITVVLLLLACSHAGLVIEGLHYFEAMSSVYGIAATVEHYVCVVDLLGRAGRLCEAEELISAMSCEPDVTVWIALLSACRLHGDVEMGERVGNRVLEMDPGNASGYVLLSNIYAAAGKWDLKEIV